MTFSDACQDVLRFRDERDWKQFHNPKDLAISLSLEAAELLECFQWSGAQLEPRDPAHLREELADVLIYGILLADAQGIDIPQAIEAKLEKNRAHYPIEQAKGSARKYSA